MKLDFIPLDKLVISKANMRYGKKAPDVSDILPTVRRRGVIQPVIVRPNCAPDGFEIVAGARRFTAASIVADERARRATWWNRCHAPSSTRATMPTPSKRR